MTLNLHRGWVIVMASVFGDESADETAQRVFAVAGLVGTDEQWNALADKWVTATGGREFHAAEWETEFSNDPDTEKHKKNLRIYAELAQLLASSGLQGCGVGLDLAAYKECFPSTNANTSWAYYKCFIETSDRLVQKAKKIGFTDLKFTFDHRQGENNSGVLYDWMTSLPEWKETGIFFDNEVSFSSRKNPRIQVADLMARETMKHLDNIIGPKQRGPRKSLIALATTQERLDFTFLMRGYFEDQKQKMPELTKAHGMSEREYHDWLIKLNAQDNLTSRFRFLTWFDANQMKSQQ
jgi:hypothetical protein